MVSRTLERPGRLTHHQGRRALGLERVGTADSRRHGPSGIPNQYSTESRSWMLHRSLFPGLPRKRPVDNPGSGFGNSDSGFRRGHVCGNQLYSPPRQSPLVSHSESISGYSHQSVDSIPSDTHGQCVFSSNEGNSEFPGTLCTTAVGNRRPGPRDFFQPLQGSFGHLLSCLALFGTALEHTIRVADIRAAN